MSARADLVGSPRRDLPTPALIIDRGAMERNVAAMAGWARGKTGLRPHAKVHKCVEIARRQLDAGAIGITVATVAEAMAMSASGAPRDPHRE